MAARAGDKTAAELHSDLITAINEEMLPEDFKAVKIRVRAFPEMPAGNLKKCEDLADVAERMEEKGLLGVGNYDYLRKALGSLARLQTIVENYNQKIKQAMGDPDAAIEARLGKLDNTNIPELPSAGTDKPVAEAMMDQ